MTNLHDIIIDRSPLEKAIRRESMIAELALDGLTVVSTDWLRRLNKEILKRNLENVS